MHPDFLTVGEVARLVGVSVRTLHHYESVGLLTPSQRSASGYRLYSADDIDRLHTILVYRALEFPLEKIQQILVSGTAPIEELISQRDLLQEKQEHLQSVLDSVQTMIEVHTMKKTMSAADRAKASHAQYRDEAEAAYGSTDAYQQSAQRVAGFTDHDWTRVSDRMDAFEQACARALAGEVAPGSDEANKLAEEHLSLMQNYFDCSYNQQVLIGMTYVSDPRFTAHYNQRSTGLAAWISAAINANAVIHGVDIDTPVWQ